MFLLIEAVLSQGRIARRRPAEASGLTVSPSCRSRSAELPRCHAGGGRPAARARPFPSSVAGKHLSYAYQVTPRADSAAGDNFVFQIAGGAGKEAETTKQVPRLSLGVIPRHQREMPLLDARAAPEGNRQLHIIMWHLTWFFLFFAAWQSRSLRLSCKIAKRNQVIC